MPLCTCGSHQRPVCRNKFSSSAIRDLGMPLPTELALQHVIKLFHLVLGIKPRCLCKLSVHFTTVQPNIIVCLFGFGFLCFFLSLSHPLPPSLSFPSSLPPKAGVPGGGTCQSLAVPLRLPAQGAAPPGSQVFGSQETLQAPGEALKLRTLQTPLRSHGDALTLRKIL